MFFHPFICIVKPYFSRSSCPTARTEHEHIRQQHEESTSRIFDIELHFHHQFQCSQCHKMIAAGWYLDVLHILHILSEFFIGDLHIADMSILITTIMKIVNHNTKVFQILSGSFFFLILSPFCSAFRSASIRWWPSGKHIPPPTPEQQKRRRD